MDFSVPPPFASIYYTSATNAAGDRLVVGNMGNNRFQDYLNALPPSAGQNQKFCAPQELAPGYFADAYVPSPAERAGDFSLFNGLLIDPQNNLPFPGGLIPTNRLLGGTWAWRIASTGTPPSSFTGTYYFRHVLLATTGADVVETRSAAGTMVFNGGGNFTFSGQQLVNAVPATAFSGAGTYLVKSSGVVTFTNPLQPTSIVTGRLGIGALVGSSTEAGRTTFDIFIAIPAAGPPVGAPRSNTALTGAYRVSTLEFPGGGVTSVRNTNFKLTANGTGAFAETSVTGQARNLGNQVLTQNVGPITYSISSDATGLLSFPAGSSTGQLVAGSKNIFVSADGTYFIGGSMAPGGHGLVVGVKSFVSGATHDSWHGFFHTASLGFDAEHSRLAGASGAVNVVTPGAVWASRTRQSDGLFDASVLLTYSLDAEGAGPFLSTSGQISLGSTGDVFSTTGVAMNSTTYELSFGVRMPPAFGSGVFIDPQRVLNSANYGLGYPISPGGFFSIFGTGLASKVVTTTPGITFPTTLGGVTVTLNGTPVPLYVVSPTLIHAIVPFAATGTTATVVVTSNGVPSNSVEVPLSPTAPGIFTLPQNGLGDGATLHADFSVVSAANPARASEVVLVFLAGLGAVTPVVTDGGPAPSAEPLARTSTLLQVTVDGLPCIVQYSGLAPFYAGLYQLNIQLPPDLLPGTHNLAVQTPEAFTDMAIIVTGP